MPRNSLKQKEDEHKILATKFNDKITQAALAKQKGNDKLASLFLAQAAAIEGQMARIEKLSWRQLRNTDAEKQFTSIVASIHKM